MKEEAGLLFRLMSLTNLEMSELSLFRSTPGILQVPLENTLEVHRPGAKVNAHCGREKLRLCRHLCAWLKLHPHENKRLQTLKFLAKSIQIKQAGLLLSLDC